MLSLEQFVYLIGVDEFDGCHFLFCCGIWLCGRREIWDKAMGMAFRRSVEKAVAALLLQSRALCWWKGRHVPGAKAHFAIALNVRAKARTYLRNKTKRSWLPALHSLTRLMPLQHHGGIGRKGPVRWGYMKSFGVLRLRSSQSARATTLRMTILWGIEIKNRTLTRIARSSDHRRS